jgi:hypothetical protein
MRGSFGGYRPSSSFTVTLSSASFTLTLARSFNDLDSQHPSNRDIAFTISITGWNIVLVSIHLSSEYTSFGEISAQIYVSAKYDVWHIRQRSSQEPRIQLENTSKGN